MQFVRVKSLKNSITGTANEAAWAVLQNLAFFFAQSLNLLKHSAMFFLLNHRGFLS